MSPLRVALMGGTKVAPLVIQSRQVTAAVVIGGAASKRVQTLDVSHEGRAAKKARTAGPSETTPPSSADKGKQFMGQLSLAPDNELLNAIEVTLESLPASVVEMLCNWMFRGTPDASDPRFLSFISHLARSTNQQAAFNSRLWTTSKTA